MSTPNPVEANIGAQLPAPLTPESLPRIVANAAVPKIYVQSFSNFASAVEVTMVAANCGVPNALLTMSYPTAKSLSNALLDMLRNYEAVMGPVLSTEEAQAKFIPASIK